MPEIVLTDEQFRTLATAGGAVTVRDPRGNPVGVLDTGEAAHIAEARRRLSAGGPRVPAVRVRAHLQALQSEWERVGGFDAAYLAAFLDRLRAQDAP